MIQGSLGRRYSLALIEIAEEAKILPQIQKEINLFGNLLEENSFLFHTLCNQTLSRSEKKNVLTKILNKLKTSEIGSQFLKLLIDKQRMNIFPDIKRQFGILADQRSGIQKAQLYLAHPLEPSTQEEIQKELSRITGKKIQLEVKEVPELIGGIKAQIGDSIFDGSILSQLEKLKKQILNQKQI